MRTGGGHGAGRRTSSLVAVGGDLGAAPVEFVLVGTLLTALFVALLQLGIALYIRNVAVSSASEGARYAANADRSCADGVGRTLTLLHTAMPGRVGHSGPSPTCAVDGGVVDVTVSVELPAMGFVGRVGRLTVHGHALKEGA